MADPPDTPRRPRLNVRTSSWSPSHFLSANPNESDRACPPARTYAVRPPSAVPIATPGAVPNASVIGPAYYCSSSIRAAHGCSSVWAADGYPAPRGPRTAAPPRGPRTASYANWMSDAGATALSGCGLTGTAWATPQSAIATMAEMAKGSTSIQTLRITDPPFKQLCPVYDCRSVL